MRRDTYGLDRSLILGCRLLAQFVDFQLESGNSSQTPAARNRVLAKLRKCRLMNCPLRPLPPMSNGVWKLVKRLR